MQTQKYSIHRPLIESPPNPMTHPFSVRIFLVDGDPTGIKTVEKTNWSGVGLMFPQSLFAEARKRPELQRTGVYILVGPGESVQLPKVYIGEGDPFTGASVLRSCLSSVRRHKRTSEGRPRKEAGRAYPVSDRNIHSVLAAAEMIATGCLIVWNGGM